MHVHSGSFDGLCIKIKCGISAVNFERNQNRTFNACCSSLRFFFFAVCARVAKQTNSKLERCKMMEFYGRKHAVCCLLFPRQSHRHTDDEETGAVIWKSCTIFRHQRNFPYEALHTFGHCSSFEFVCAMASHGINIATCVKRIVGEKLGKILFRIQQLHGELMKYTAHRISEINAHFTANTLMFFRLYIMLWSSRLNLVVSCCLFQLSGVFFPLLVNVFYINV